MILHRKTINGEDILFAMRALGFENYAEVLTIYLAKYREVSELRLVADVIRSLNQGPIIDVMCNPGFA